MINKIKGVIFDLDGTLIDSMWIWEQIDIDYFNKLNIPMPKDLKDKINHLSFKDTAIYFKNTFNIPDSIDEICEEWNNRALFYYSNKVALKQGVLKLLKFLKSRNIKIALATSNSEILLKASLTHTKIIDYFDVISTTSEVNNGKNKPDIYLLTANKLSLDPKNCLVFEDIYEAIIGAKSAGMTVCAIYDKYSDYNKDKITKLSDFYIKDFTEIIPKIV